MASIEHLQQPTSSPVIAWLSRRHVYLNLGPIGRLVIEFYDIGQSLRGHPWVDAWTESNCRFLRVSNLRLMLDRPA